MHKILQQTIQYLTPRALPFLTWWPKVSKATLKADVIAGITGGVIVLPQGVAFAMIAGLPPIYGLYTAMVTPVIAALFGSSMHLVSGPTTAISLVVFASLKGYAVPGTPEYIDLVLVMTFLAGAFQFGMGLAKFGNLVNFVSHSVVVAFTAGAAFLIAASQLRYVFDIDVPNGLAFHQTLWYLGVHAFDINIWTGVITVLTLFIAGFIKRKWPRWPHFFTTMILLSIVVYFVQPYIRHVPVIGAIDGGPPAFRIPSLTLDNFNKLGSSAFAIALLGLLEAVAIARSIAIKSGQRIDANQEFIGQGLSNLTGSFFSSYAGSGSFTRTGMNYAAGAQTPLSSVFAAIILFLLTMLVSPLAAYLPVATMAGVILFVSYTLIDFANIKKVLLSSKGETTVLLATFFATLFFNLELAIFIGVFLSLFFYLRRTAKPHIAVMAPNQEDSRHHFINIVRQEGILECPQIKIVRIDGSLFFGAIDHVDQYFAELKTDSFKNIIIMAEGINDIDLAGAEWLQKEAANWQEKGGCLYIVGLKIIAQDVLLRSGIKSAIGKQHFISAKKDAVLSMYRGIDKGICSQCTHRIFWECQKEFGKVQ